VKEPTVPVAVLRETIGLLHIISSVPKAYRVTQARSYRASRAAACLIAMGLRGVRALFVWSKSNGGADPFPRLCLLRGPTSRSSI
jgi:hypothetical protein